METNGILQKLVYLQSETRFLQPSNALAKVPRRKIALYISLQITGVAATIAISQTIAAIGFPVLIIALIPLRTFLMPKWFTKRELNILDNLTADNKAVLASLGGRPAGIGDEKDEDGEPGGEEIDPERRSGIGESPTRQRSRSAVRQRAGSITR